MFRLTPLINTCSFGKGRINLLVDARQSVGNIKLLAKALT